MRLWTVHPGYLDARGLTAAWREGLLARAVLAGKTKGYRRHPQLERFRAQKAPVAAVDAYLSAILEESRRRGYRFDARKIAPARRAPRIAVTRGQLAHEWAHLGRKLRARSSADYRRWKAARPRAHPLFRVKPGGVEPWEKATDRRSATSRARA